MKWRRNEPKTWKLGALRKDFKEKLFIESCILLILLRTFIIPYSSKFFLMSLINPTYLPIVNILSIKVDSVSSLIAVSSIIWPINSLRISYLTYDELAKPRLAVKFLKRTWRSLLAWRKSDLIVLYIFLSHPILKLTSEGVVVLFSRTTPGFLGYLIVLEELLGILALTLTYDPS